MNHFLSISQLSQSDVRALIERAMFFKNNTIYPQFSRSSVINLFYENSTRTRVSFELAAKYLSMPVIHLDLQSSSEAKGEAIFDTVKTLAGMGVKVIVTRHKQDGLPQLLAEACGDGVSIINAGDGVHEHPSQAMLDLMTILEQKPNLDKLKIAIVGNIRHSRVANSLQSIFALLGVGDLTLVAPSQWLPLKPLYGRVTSSLAEGISGADVVICLRVQQERLQRDEQLDLKRYHEDYAINKKNLAYAHKEVMVMHPGPINRGIEIDSDVADGPESYILQQVRNGIFMRMAILEWCL